MPQQDRESVCDRGARLEKIKRVALLAWKKFTEKNVALRLFVLAQAVALLLIAVNTLGAPRHELHFQPLDFQAGGLPTTSVDENGFYYRPDSARSTAWKATFDLYEIKSGAYEITVRYRSDCDGTQSVANSAGYLRVFSSRTIKGESILLDDGHTEATGRFWVPLGADADDFSVSVDFTGAGEADVYGVDIVEQPIYRVTRLLGILAVLALLDLVLYVFFAKGVSRGKRTKEVLLLAAIALAASLPHLTNILQEGHDLKFHLLRISTLAGELKNGQFPVRMLHEMCNGFGYATPLYYCDIFLYPSALLYNMMVPLQLAYKIYAVGVNIATAWVSYYCFSAITGSKRYGMFGAALYTLSAYRLINLYLRAALGEYTAMVFLPVILLGVFHIYTAEKPRMRDWMPLALGMSGVVMSHILTTQMAAVFLVIFCLVAIKRTLRPTTLLAIAKAAGVAVALCAWFIVPFLQSYVGMQTLVTARGIQWIQCTGTYLLQLIGISFTANGGGVNDGIAGEMPLTLGLALSIGIAMVLYYFIKRDEWKTEGEQHRRISVMFLLGLLAAVFSLHFFPWDGIQGGIVALLDGGMGVKIAELLGSIQFSWRYLAIATVLLVPASLLVLAELVRRKPAHGKLVAVLMAAGLVLNMGSFYTGYTDGAEEYTYYHLGRSDTLHVMGAEYYLDGTELHHPLVDEIEHVRGSVEVLSYTEENGVRHLTCRNSGGESAVLDLPFFAYDHFHAYDAATGTELELNCRIANANRTTVVIPAGFDGTVEIRYEPPVLWRVAEIVSLLSVLALVGLGVKRAQDGRKRRKENDAETAQVAAQTE